MVLHIFVKMNVIFVGLSMMVLVTWPLSMTLGRYIADCSDLSFCITCKARTYVNLKINPKQHHNVKDYLMICECEPPETSYADFISQKGINVTSLKSFALLDIQNSSKTLEEKHFAGLSIEKLELSWSTGIKTITTVEANFLNQLSKLTALKVIGMITHMPPLPPQMKIKQAEFEKGAFQGKIGSCDELRTLQLTQWTAPAEAVLTPCHRLTNLVLINMLPETVSRLIQDTKNLKSLWVIDCGDFLIRNISFDLRTLYLHNSYFDITLQPSLQSLEVLYVAFTNKLVALVNHGIAEMFKIFSKLRMLETSIDICKYRSKDLEIKHLRLKKMSLLNTRTSLNCLEAGSFPSLRYLGLRGREKDVLQFQELQISNVSLKVDLIDTSILEVNLTKTDYKNAIEKKLNLKKNLPIILTGLMKLDCDCRNGWFAAALRDKIIVASEARCKTNQNKTHLILIPPDQLECDKFLCDKCTCRLYWRNNSLEADCSETAIKKIPKLPGLSKLIAPKNHIVLRKSDIPDGLLFLDLRKNDISSIDLEVTEAIFSKPERKILLSDNPILCACENFAFIQALQKFSKKILDYDNVTCAGNGKVVKNVSLSELCLVPREGADEALHSALIAGGAMLIVVLLIAAFHWRYGKAVHMFLYARGLLCCVNEEKLDADRLYDAFVSFCHLDGTAADEIVTWLEKRNFKVCVHYRDWKPGEMILAQIVHSAETSRRTVILLSQHFVESMWGMLEFRTAHARALKDGVTRIILVVLDDVVDNDNLNEDLRRYIQFNTYVRFDDTWFWDKFYYAMPKRQTQPNYSNDLSAVRDGLPCLPVLINEPIQSISPLPVISNESTPSLIIHESVQSVLPLPALPNSSTPS